MGAARLEARRSSPRSALRASRRARLGPVPLTDGGSRPRAGARPGSGPSLARRRRGTRGRTASGGPFHTRSPFGAPVAGRTRRTGCASRRRACRLGSVATGVPFGTPISCLRAALGGLGTAGVRALAAPGRSTITTARSAPATGAVEKVAAVTAVATPFGDEHGGHGRDGLGRSEQLDATSLGRLFFRRQNGQDRDPVYLDFRLHAQDISHLGAVGEDLAVDDPFGLPGPRGAPGVAPVAPGAGQFDVETIRHAPVKLPSAAGFAKRGSPEGRESPRAAGASPTRYNLNRGT
jgi:hypothetical protein